MRVELIRVGLPFAAAPYAPKKTDLAVALKAAGLPQKANLDPLYKGFCQISGQLAESAIRE